MEMLITCEKYCGESTCLICTMRFHINNAEGNLFCVICLLVVWETNVDHTLCAWHM